MEFQPAETINENFYDRYVSKNKIWEFGLTKLGWNGGTRIRVGRVGSGCVEIDRCCGNDEKVIMKMLLMLMAVLNEVPERITAWEINRLIPQQRYKPYDQDPDFVRFVEGVLRDGYKYKPKLWPGHRRLTVIKK